ncbi:unnamed protein product [Cuscuta campestris]|uniref:Uncharacterized protein n=1 Tax=Cuscuta campestris TaxID=132261 RepID=A0A484L4L3_9ASTE|nr:unnamed protein product [Cuscuta campestris]
MFSKIIRINYSRIVRKKSYIDASSLIFVLEIPIIPNPIPRFVGSIVIQNFILNSYIDSFERIPRVIRYILFPFDDWERFLFVFCIFVKTNPV